MPLLGFPLTYGNSTLATELPRDDLRPEKSGGHGGDDNEEALEHSSRNVGKRPAL